MQNEVMSIKQLEELARKFLGMHDIHPPNNQNIERWWKWVLMFILNSYVFRGGGRPATIGDNVDIRDLEHRTRTFLHEINVKPPPDSIERWWKWVLAFLLNTYVFEQGGRIPNNPVPPPRMPPRKRPWVSPVAPVQPVVPGASLGAPTTCCDITNAQACIDCPDCWWDEHGTGCQSNGGIGICGQTGCDDSFGRYTCCDITNPQACIDCPDCWWDEQCGQWGNDCCRSNGGSNLCNPTSCNTFRRGGRVYGHGGNIDETGKQLCPNGRIMYDGTCPPEGY